MPKKIKSQIKLKKVTVAPKGLVVASLLPVVTAF